MYEALLAITYSKHGLEKVRESVSKLMTWVDSCIDTSELTKQDSIQDITLDEVKSNTESIVKSKVENFQKNKQSSQLENWLKKVDKQISMEHHDLLEKLANTPTVSGIHLGKIIEVSWVSRSGNTWRSDFYLCCGQSVSDARFCSRVEWKNPKSIHTGILHLGGSKKKGGGRQNTTSHLPIPGIPVWTCCRNDASEEGCCDLSDESKTYFAF